MKPEITPNSVAIRNLFLLNIYPPRVITIFIERTLSSKFEVKYVDIENIVYKLRSNTPECISACLRLKHIP